MATAVGLDEDCPSMHFPVNDPRFVDVPTTTWIELKEHKRIKLVPHKDGPAYRLTGSGWVTIVGNEHYPERAGIKFTLPSDALHSRAAGADYIFIYSTSLQPNLTEFEGEDEPNACVEIHDTAKFLARLLAALRRWPGAKANTLIHDQVKYYSPTNDPNPIHSLPDRITMHKHKFFLPQCEYRFAFGTKADVFDCNNVRPALIGEAMDQARRDLNPLDHRKTLRIGPLDDCCRLM
jgi:hypothetical protein